MKNFKFPAMASPRRVIFLILVRISLTRTVSAVRVSDSAAGSGPVGLNLWASRGLARAVPRRPAVHPGKFFHISVSPTILRQTTYIVEIIVHVYCFQYCFHCFFYCLFIVFLYCCLFIVHYIVSYYSLYCLSCTIFFYLFLLFFSCIVFLLFHIYCF